jgi:hypothetical protein
MSNGAAIVYLIVIVVFLLMLEGARSDPED